MIDSSLKALMCEAIDGILDESQEHELRRRLAAQPEARAFFDDLVRERAVLDAVPRIDPPVLLRAEVMRAIESQVSNRAPVESGGRWTRWRLIRTGLLPRLRWGYALVFAAGLIVGLLPLIGRSGLPERHADTRLLTGTLTSRKGSGEAVAVTQSEISLGPVRGHAKVSHAAERIIIDLDLASVGEVDVFVEFDPAAYRLEGFERQDEGTGEMGTAAGQVRLTKFARGQIRVILEENPSITHPPLRVIARQGMGTFEQPIEVHGDRR